MDYQVTCPACGCPSESLLEFKCPSCSKALEVQLGISFEAERIRKKDFTVWRYKDFFPYVKEEEIVSLGEGWTPLVKFSNSLYFKLENLEPTGSFKDRGSTVLISSLKSMVKESEGYISEDSSGNAGASIAAYSARARLKAKIYVPQSVSGPKFNQIMRYDAEVVKVAGSRNRVAEEAQKPEKGKFYVGHIVHPLFRDGIRSLAYEIAERFDWHIPECVYLPVSAGTLLLGVIRGFQHLVKANVVELMPKIVACQTRQVSPLYHRLKNLHYRRPEKITSVADALVSIDPPLLDIMAKSLKDADGDAVVVEEDEILEAFGELARAGFFVEPSSAVAYAGYKKQLDSKTISKSEKAVVILTGMGLKSTLDQ